MRPAPYWPGKDAVLIGQVDARGIHQVDDGQAVAHGDFLRAQNLGDGFRPPGAGLDGGVVGHDDGGAAFDAAEAGDDAGGGRLTVVAVVGDQQADFEEACAGVDQGGDALARGHLAGLVLTIDARLPAALAEAGFERLNLFDKVAHVRLALRRPRYFNLEKSAGSMKTDSGGLARILPFFSDSAATFCHSGSARNAAQFFVAASRLGCVMM